ncbi:MAG: hypothetical protein K2L83_04870 [Muribaculaceae bacterium]|nr:hypothetical protein [Muribaculaceae bacterium]
MIKVGIAGADSRIAGEILRLCLHHPDVDIVSAYAPAYAGRSVASVHTGFIGEPRLLFSSSFDATALDVAFIMHPIYSDSDWAKLMSDRKDLRLIIFPGAESVAGALPSSPVYGLSEINRKPMVRGAREAIVPDCVASPVLVALYPLAMHLMLSGDIDIRLSAPADIITPERLAASCDEIRRILASVQTSYNGNVRITACDSGAARRMLIEMKITSATPVEELLKIYDSVYDDHNFTHVVTSPITPAEVESTERVVISVGKSAPSEISLTVAADPRMRGGAGEAIHIMNLFLGLHETTGLDLRSTAWEI